jgi:molybdopterin converting factor small subunit
MVITVRFIGSFRSQLGKGEIKLKYVNNLSLKKAIQKIVETSANHKRASINTALGNPKTNALILINGKEINVLNGLETRLQDGDEVVFISILHGG